MTSDPRKDTCPDVEKALSGGFVKETLDCMRLADGVSGPPGLLYRSRRPFCGADLAT